jgi:hypothetical protein
MHFSDAANARAHRHDRKLRRKITAGRAGAFSSEVDMVRVKKTHQNKKLV